MTCCPIEKSTRAGRKYFAKYNCRFNYIKIHKDNMEHWHRKIAVITGAAGGIGSAIAKEFLEHEIIVIGIDNNQQKLTELSSDLPNKNFHHLHCNLANKESINNSFQWIEQYIGPISILVNCAVLTFPESLLEIPTSKLNEMFQVNLTAPILCSKMAINSMLKNDINDGHIINLSSFAGFVLPMPTTIPVTYSICKHAMNVISQGFEAELQNRNSDIRITNLSPSWVSTDLTKLMKKIKKLDPKDIADACISILEKSSKFQINQLTLKAPGSFITEK